VSDAPSNRPPAWLLAATGVLALTILGLSVAETSYRAHYLIDQGDYVSIIGLVFITGAGLVLFRRQRLFVSLPLVFPWLLYPVITQGDQLIDNMSINPMRAVCHVLLAAIFATPVAVVVLGTKYAIQPAAGAPITRRSWTAVFPGLRPFAEGRAREGTALMGTALLVMEMWLADQYLGTLMIITLIVMIILLLLYGSSGEPEGVAASSARMRTELLALVVLVAGVVVSGGVYFGYKNAPGAYQGSPSFFMDPAKQDSTYRLDRVAVPSRPPVPPDSPNDVREALTGYGHTLERMLAGYHILDRNYTYDFHNALFMRQTPLVPNYRVTGLHYVDEARELKASADAHAGAARATLVEGDPLRALLDDVSGYVAFNFDRAPVLEQMSAGFERTPAGLQHAAHLYEGESKFLGARLIEVIHKHQAVMDAPLLAPVTQEFAATSRAIFDAYAHHVVGF
jgi:hypothetical protein